MFIQTPTRILIQQHYVNSYTLVYVTQTPSYHFVHKCTIDELLHYYIYLLGSLTG